MRTATMYDSVNVAAIPAGATMVAGYVSGEVTWPALVARFPKARKVSITITPAMQADVFDIESGAGTPAQVPQWVLDMRALRRRPIVYTTRDVWNSAVVPACRAAGVAVPFWWCAGWTGTPYLEPGSCATQWCAPGNGSPGDYDVSLVDLTTFPSPYRKKAPVEIKIPDTQRMAALLRQAAAIVAEVVAIGNQAHLPASVRAVIASAGGIILAIEHFVADPSTGK